MNKKALSLFIFSLFVAGVTAPLHATDEKISVADAVAEALKPLVAKADELLKKYGNKSNTSLLNNEGYPVAVGGDYSVNFKSLEGTEGGVSAASVASAVENAASSLKAVAAQAADNKVYTVVTSSVESAASSLKDYAHQAAENKTYTVPAFDTDFVLYERVPDGAAAQIVKDAGQVGESISNRAKNVQLSLKEWLDSKTKALPATQQPASATKPVLAVEKTWATKISENPGTTAAVAVGIVVAAYGLYKLAIYLSDDSKKDHEADEDDMQFSSEESDVASE